MWMETMGQRFQGQYKGRTIRLSIVWLFPLKQEVCLPVEDRQTLASLGRRIYTSSGTAHPLGESCSDLHEWSHQAIVLQCVNTFRRTQDP